MTKRDIISGDNNGFVFVIVLLCLLLSMIYLSSIDKLNFEDVNKIQVYNNEGEQLEKGFLQEIDDNYSSYLNSAYDYKAEIHQSRYTLSGEVVVEEVEKIGDGYKIKTKGLSGTTTAKDSNGNTTERQMLIFARDSRLDTESENYERIIKITEGSKIYVKGELNTISDKFYVINKIEKLEVR